MFVAKSIKVIWFLVCFAGNVYQVAQISENFFEYQIVTTINVNYPAMFLVPAISVCLFEIHVTNIEKLMELKPNLKEDLNISSLSKEEFSEKINGHDNR